MRKIALLLAASILLLMVPGCSTGETAAPFLPLEEQIAIDISVEETMSDAVRDGMRLFAGKINRLSGGTILLNIYYESDPYQSLLDGNADVIYCSSELMSSRDSNFSVYSSPFFFRSYEHMTMTLNSDLFRDLTEQDFQEILKVKKLGAVFGGTSVLVSNKRYIIDQGDLDGLSIGTDGDPYTQYVFQQFGANTQPLDTQSRYDRFDSGRLDTLECSTLEIDQLPLGNMEDVFLAETFHSTQVEWLFVSSSFYDGLSKERQAYLQEAAAYLISTVDKARLEDYAAGLESQSGMELTVTRLDLEPMRSSAKQYLYSNPEFFSLTNWEFYDSVQAIIR